MGKFLAFFSNLELLSFPHSDESSDESTFPPVNFSTTSSGINPVLQSIDSSQSSLCSDDIDCGDLWQCKFDNNFCLLEHKCCSNPTEVETDPEGDGLLVPNFRNKFSPADEDEELFTIPWGKESYINNYPKLNRPSDK